MNAMVSVRRATMTDRRFVRDLGRRVAATSVSSIRSGTPALVEEAYERLVDYVLTRDHAILIAHDGAAALGFVLVVFDLPEEVTLTDQAFIAYMAVEPACVRRGIGRALLDAVEALATERGMPHLSLMVTEDNVPARALYESGGFATERRLMTKAL